LSTKIKIKDPHPFELLLKIKFYCAARVEKGLEGEDATKFPKEFQSIEE